MPKEISNQQVVCAKVIDKNHKRSLLVQGGFEIPVQVTVEMDLTGRNKAILEKYRQDRWPFR